MQKKVAIIADIHGNSWALKSVLVDIKDRGIEKIINLGDSLNGPLDPQGTFKLLVENEILSISGNGDRLILENLQLKTNNLTAEYILSQMNSDIISWLKNLSFDCVYNDIYCCHGSPRSDMEYLLESLEPEYIDIRAFSEIDKILSGIKQNIIVCGHSHVPRIIKSGDKVICNVGSVGLPAYNDELPIPHKMQNYNPYASYTIITESTKSFNIEQVTVSYDYEQAVKKAILNKREDWAKWIRTGRV